MIKHLITRAALWWLRRYQPSALAYFHQRRPARPTTDELWWERQINAVGRRVR